MTEGWYPALESDTKKIQARVDLIKTCLGELTRSCLVVKNVTSLSKVVQKFISEAEGEPCSHITFLSNTAYRILLNEFIDASRKTSVRKSRRRLPELDQDPVANKMLDDLSYSNLEKRYTRLKVYATGLEKELDSMRGGNAVLPPVVIEGQSAAFAQVHGKFVRTCQALSLLLRNLEQIVGLDHVAKTIIDKDEMTANSIIVPTEYAKDFFEWTLSNGDR